MTLYGFSIIVDSMRYEILSPDEKSRDGYLNRILLEINKICRDHDLNWLSKNGLLIYKTNNGQIAQEHTTDLVFSFIKGYFIGCAKTYQMFSSEIKV
jgi:hypothetical protein